MPDEACWRELNQAIGGLKVSVDSLRVDIKRVDEAYDRKLDALSDKMIECVSICEKGHTRINQNVKDISEHKDWLNDHEERLREIEKFTGTTATEKKWTFAIVASIWSLGSYVAFKVIESHWSAIKDAFR